MKTQTARVGKRLIELSNLRKTFFPDEGIVKAQVVEYYFQTAPAILAHLKGRPLTLVRYPDGIRGESFFQKNRPEWAPGWIQYASLGEERKDYVLATEEASLVWLANLACVELHQIHARAPHFDRPDYLVYDFDPPEDYPFREVAKQALAFKSRLEDLGYHAFVKTTGRKGLHVLTPIEPQWSFEQAFAAARSAAQPFVDERTGSLTLQIKKELRKGRVLLDIYRNRPLQTIVAAYSLRGLPGAPVSTPLEWDELDSLEDPRAFNLATVPERLKARPDPWEALSAFAARLHNVDPPASSSRRAPKPSRTYKTAAQLEIYSAKRRFGKTSEPRPAIESAAQSRFVVHRHHASRLHYDLRLEQDGVLRSWAIPKGLPPRPGILRLAVQVEDHPVEYLQFEGEIPKGEYGGGTMWRFATGRYEITKKKKDGFYFRLHSAELNAEYRMHRSKQNQWLLERVDRPQMDWLRDPVRPMLAQAADAPPVSNDYLYEVKWDGIRALVSIDEGETSIRGRNGTNLTTPFPELTRADQAFRATSALFDAEIVCLEADGRPNFQDVIHRMRQGTENAARRAQARRPAVCYVFDCLYLDGRSIVNEPLARRREWLEDALKGGSAYRLSQGMEDGPALFQAATDLGLEGIMAKERASVYRPGVRSDAWVKIKGRQTAQCLIVGYTSGRGDRADTIGAVHLAELDGRALRYVGKAGTGFDHETLKDLTAALADVPRAPLPFQKKLPDPARTTWVEPKLACEVRFASRTRDGMLREPVFERLRPDLGETGS